MEQINSHLNLTKISNRVLKRTLTVAMPVYNGEKYLKTAIQSVLDQTFKDFELLIINDGSTDNSLEIIDSFNDRRIKVIHNDHNKGIAFSRNVALQEANSDFIAWTDCDDLNLPTRFEEQIQYLRSNPHIGGCGTWLARFKGDNIHFITKAFEDPDILHASLLFSPATIPNATVMLKLSDLRKMDLMYDITLPVSEDYDFIVKCSKHFRFSNIQKVLYKYRASETSIMNLYNSRESESFQIHSKIYTRILAGLHLNPNHHELKLHYTLCSNAMLDSFTTLENCLQWLIAIEKANDDLQVYDKSALHFVLGKQFYFVSKKASAFGLKTFGYYINNSLNYKWKLSAASVLKLIIRCLLKHDQFELRINRS